MREFDEAARRRDASVQSVEPPDPFSGAGGPAERPVGLPTQEWLGEEPRVARTA
jgi:hypothetical protein